MKLLRAASHTRLAILSCDEEPEPAVEVALRVTERHHEGTLTPCTVEETLRFIATAPALRKLARDLVNWADDAEEAVAAIAPKPPQEEGRAAA